MNGGTNRRGAHRLLCVDLDGTPVKSHTLFEPALRLVKSNPRHLLILLL